MMTESKAIKVSVKWGGGYTAVQQKTISGAKAPALYQFGESGRFLPGQDYIIEIEGLMNRFEYDLSPSAMLELKRLKDYCSWRQKLYDL
jgi:hypothetical protein